MGQNIGFKNEIYMFTNMVARVNIIYIDTLIRRYVMKRNVLLSVLLVSMFACPAVLSQEFEMEDLEVQMEIKAREMDMRQREAEMSMEREMQNLELEQRRMELERAREEIHHDDDDDDNDECHCGGALGLLLLICVIIRILLAVWVYMDIHKLGHGSGIWIVIVLLAGLLGALVYAIVRIGDNRGK